MHIKELDRTDMKDEKIPMEINDHYKLFEKKRWKLLIMKNVHSVIQE